MPLRLDADECVDGRVLAGLRRRGVDVVTAHEEGLLSASDHRQIERASQLGRTAVTVEISSPSFTISWLAASAFRGCSTSPVGDLSGRGDSRHRGSGRVESVTGAN